MTFVLVVIYIRNYKVVSCNIVNILAYEYKGSFDFECLLKARMLQFFMK